MLPPLAVLMATDYYLTVYVYHYSFRCRATCQPGLVCSGHVLGRFCFMPGPALYAWARQLCWANVVWLVSDYAYWPPAKCIRTRLRAGRLLVAALPFYRNDLLSTGIVAGLAFGVPCWYGA